MTSAHPIHYSAIILALALPIAECRDPDWFDSTMAKIEASQSLSADERIPLLGRLASIGHLNLSRDRKIDTEQHAVWRRAQRELLVIPGHAEWYRDDLERRYKEWEYQRGPYKASMWSEFETYRNWNFQSLSQMPSPEAVRVLGEMLGDIGERISDETTPTDTFFPIGAAGALNVLGFAKPPVMIEKGRFEPNKADPSELITWRLWYAQVKAGTRTYRFKGDGTEYGLNGAITHPSAKETPPPHPNTKEAQLQAEKIATVSQFNPWPLAAALVLLLTVILWTWRNATLKKNAPPS